MRSRLFPDAIKTIQISTGRWLRMVPYESKGYLLQDMVEEVAVGYILVDRENFWIYDGQVLDLDEQEEIAGHILGHQQEMSRLMMTIDLNV